MSAPPRQETDESLAPTETDEMETQENEMDDHEAHFLEPQDSETQETLVDEPMDM
jgi:hypothetical protein